MEKFLLVTNMLILPVPSLLGLLPLWFCLYHLDRLPEDDFEGLRSVRRYALFNLIMILVFIGFTIYNVPRLLETIPVS